jgi:hypothetical protein
MQIPSGQIPPSPTTIQALGTTQRPGIAEAPEKSAQTAAPDQQVARAEAPAAPQQSAPPASEPSRPLPRGSVIDLKV